MWNKTLPYYAKVDAKYVLQNLRNYLTRSFRIFPEFNLYFFARRMTIAIPFPFLHPRLFFLFPCSACGAVCCFSGEHKIQVKDTKRTFFRLWLVVVVARYGFFCYGTAFQLFVITKNGH